jgi:hypothetical protein
MWMPLLVLVVIVGSRGFAGTDTTNYIYNLNSTVDCDCIVGQYNYEIGFQALTYILSLPNLGNDFYLTGLCLALFFIANVAVKKAGYFLGYLGSERVRFEYLAFFFLLTSPFFVSVSINVLRQGLAAFFVFSAFLCFAQRQWVKGTVFSLFATSMHYSAMLSVILVPILFLRVRTVLVIAVLLSISYASGISEYLVRLFSDLTGLPIYTFVSNFGEGMEYRSGVRLDFLFFSWFWILFVSVVTPRWVDVRYRNGLWVLCKIYVVLLFPFLVVGFGSFSDRYAIVSWLFMSILVGAMCSALRVRKMFSVGVLIGMLIISCVAFGVMVVNAA